MITKGIIIGLCIEYNIKNYTINDDMSIDVKGDVNLSYKGLTELPLDFNIVEGDFYCSDNELTNLKGAPRKCKYFICHHNSELTSLDGAPVECEVFSCIGCDKLASLKGIPKCDTITTDYDNLNLDNEDLYVIEALANTYTDDSYFKDYLKIRKRNELINLILE